MDETDMISEDDEQSFETLAQEQLCNGEEEEYVLEQEEEEEEEIEEPEVLINKSHEAKLRDILRNICSSQTNAFSEASKEFTTLLKGDSGGEMLHQYIQASPSCTELMEAWKLQREKLHIFSLISVILDYPDFKSRSFNDFLEKIRVSNSNAHYFVSKRLDKFARSIVESRLEDIYTELNSGIARRQNAALLLMAAIVRRGLGIASEVAKCFDFTLKVLPKLAESKSRTGEKKLMRCSSTRTAFIKFAMSFLEASNPRLLRWILQKKEVYSGVFRGLGSDDDATVVFVLSVLQDKVLSPDSMVPPGLQSVLFGDVALEQLSNISGNPEAGSAAQVAHETLVMVCTDPCHGLMPDFSEQWWNKNLGHSIDSNGNPLKGNPGRLLRLMLRLRAVEIGYHRDLLLAIVNGRPSLASAYMDSFPYNLEPRGSTPWFGAISLASDLISAARKPLPFASLALRLHDPPPLDSPEMEYVLKCILPCSFTRLVINRGLLHSDSLVKHGSLRLLLEALTSVDNLVGAIEDALKSITVNQALDSNRIISNEGGVKLSGLPGIRALVNAGKYIHTATSGNSCAKSFGMQRWLFFKQEIQDEIRAMLPDPQVLLSLLSLNQCQSKEMEIGSKRKRTSGNLTEVPHKGGAKKYKDDIVIGGMSTELNSALPGKDENVDKELDDKKEYMLVIAGIWGLNDELSTLGNELKNAEIYFQSKLLNVLTLYLRTLPTALVEGSFDFFKIVPSNPLILSICQQQSLLSLLIEYIRQSPVAGVSIRAPELMYRHLEQLINLIYSPVQAIRRQAYILVQAAMFSTGAFDRNISEIEAWILFFPGYQGDQNSVDSVMMGVFQDLAGGLVSFFCDAVSTLGNNLYKYLDNMRCFFSKCNIEDFTPDFSPLVICVLQKCLRLLESDSGTFTSAARSVISIYVGNTLSFLLQTQVNPGSLSAVINYVLTEKFEDRCCINVDTGDCFREWRPLKNLLFFARRLLQQPPHCNLDSLAEKTSNGDAQAFLKALRKVKKIKRGQNGRWLDGAASTFSSIICAEPYSLLDSFPSLIIVAQHLFGTDYSIMSSIFFHEPRLLAEVANSWPDMFFSGLEMVGGSESTSSTITEKSIDSDSSESTAFAFSLFLKSMPFYALFPAFTSLGNKTLVGSTEFRDLLLDKLSKASFDHFIPLLRLVLFWTHKIEKSFMIDPSTGLEKLLETCFILVEHMLMRVLVAASNFDSSRTPQAPAGETFIQEVVETIFHHPSLSVFLSRLSGINKELMDASFGNDLEVFLCSSKQYLHPFDHNIMHLLKVVESSLSSLSDLHDDARIQVVRACKPLIQRTLTVFRENFTLCILGSKDLQFDLSSFYILSGLMHLISPFELLELVYWMLCQVEPDKMTCLTSLKLFSLSMAFYIAEGAFNMLASCFLRGQQKATSCCLFWEIEDRNFAAGLLEKVYYKIIEFSICGKVGRADLCLSRAVNTVYVQRARQPQMSLLPLNMVMLRIITSSPNEMLIHCIYKPSKIKATTLFQITEISPLHLSLFGQIFFSVLDKDFPSDDESILLLPVASSYFVSEFVEKPDTEHLVRVPSFYSRILLDIFTNWKHRVSGELFKVDYNVDLLSTTDELLDFFSSSLLGKAVQMLRYHFILNEKSMKKKKRLKLFDLIYLSSCIDDGLLDCDIDEIDLFSFEQTLNVINRAVSQISLSRVLLCPWRTDRDSKTNPFRRKPGEMVSLKLKPEFYLRLINCLVGTLGKIVKKFPLNLGNSKKGCSLDCYQLFKFLEVTILKTLVELIEEIRVYLIQLQCIPFIGSLTRSSLLHRFDDPVTLKALRRIILSLSEGRLGFSNVLEILLAHSQFAPTILWSDSMSDPSSLRSLFRPMPTILKPLSLLATDPNANGKGNHHDLEQRKLELLKLLRVLYHLKGHQNSTDAEKVGMDSRELMSLLLAGYGATLSETDLEIFYLMHDIESKEGSDCGGLAEMDYLWGNSSLEVRREQKLEGLLSTDGIASCESAEERRKQQFRENLPVDTRLCAGTVLHFCYDRVAWNGPTTLEKLQEDNVMDIAETRYKSREGISRYDPAFILRFAIHSLSMGYLEPLEFVGLGLLAIAFVCISSPDEGIRMLGYDSLGRFKKALENCCNNKEGLRLQLLLTYLQNGILEPWQKIPSAIAVFAAEASLILINPTNNHYLNLNQLMIRSPKVDLQSIPLFHTLLGSSSIHFRRDQEWILRLSCAGLNLDDDARIFKRKFLFELLLNFYASSLADNESKTLVLQIVKKAVKLHISARYLVVHCGLIPWLSSVISFCGELLHIKHGEPVLIQMAMVLEVVNEIISYRIITEWMQKHALEQLSELSSHLHLLFVHGMKSLKENVPLVNSILQALISTLKISQKRRLYQPHFSLSFDCLFQICKSIAVEFSSMEFCLTAKLGLKTVLMSTPPPVILLTDKEKLSTLIMWAISTALQPYPGHKFQLKDSEAHLEISSKDQQDEDPLLAKLLRWVAASVILGRLSSKSSRQDAIPSPKRSKIETMQSFLEPMENRQGEYPKDDDNGIDKALALIIFHLQQLVGINCTVLPSVVSALHLLLNSVTSYSSGIAVDTSGDKSDIPLKTLCSKIRCPIEANPAWRWSYYQPWRDLSSELTDIEKREEYQACQSVLIIFSNALGGKSQDLRRLSHRDVEKSGLFTMEVNQIVGDE